MAYKSKEVKTTVGSAVPDGFAEIASLGEEMREGYDNMEGGNLGHTDKCQRYGEAADTLEEHQDEVDVPEFLSDLEVVTLEQVNKSKRRGPSRSVRLGNAQALLQAARDRVQEWLDDETVSRTDEQKEEAEQFINDLEEHCEFDVDFPGMFG